MKLLKRIFIIVFLLYISGLPNRLGLLSLAANEIMIIFFAVTGLFSLAFYLALNRYRVKNIDFLLLFLLFIYPFLSSLTAWIIIGQPLYMGLLTFRGSFVLLTYYTLIILGFSNKSVLSYTGTTVVFIIITVIVLFFIFKINDFNLLFRKGTIVVKYGKTITKGIQFSGFTCLFIIPYIASWVRYFEKNKLRNLVFPLFIFLFSILISKARNEILTLAVIPLFMYYLKYKMFDVKFLIYTSLLVFLFFTIILTDNVVSRNFSGLLQPASLDYAHKTGDYSAYLRFGEIKAGWKWFLKYPVTGVGSASYRFHNGYMGFISDFFFVADIGIVGILVKGGIILLLFYYLFYTFLFRFFNNEDIFSITGRYITFALLIELLIGNDYLFNYTGVFVVLFMLNRSIDLSVKRSQIQ